MTVLSDRAIRAENIIDPLCKRTVFRGMSYGLSHCGVDVRVDMPYPEDIALDWKHKTIMTPYGDGLSLDPGRSVLLGIIEKFDMPSNVVGFTKDKSTWSRKGVFVAQAVLEPGWKGNLSVRLVNHGDAPVSIIHGEPIMQVVFHYLDMVPEKLYDGKYQDQQSGPQGPRYE